MWTTHPASTHPGAGWEEKQKAQNYRGFQFADKAGAKLKTHLGAFRNVES